MIPACFSADRIACRQLSVSLPTIMNKPADNYEQAFRQLSAANSQSTNIHMNVRNCSGGCDICGGYVIEKD